MHWSGILELEVLPVVNLRTVCINSERYALNLTVKNLLITCLSQKLIKSVFSCSVSMRSSQKQYLVETSILFIDKTMPWSVQLVCNRFWNFYWHEDAITTRRKIGMHCVCANCINPFRWIVLFFAFKQRQNIIILLQGELRLLGFHEMDWLYSEICPTGVQTTKFWTKAESKSEIYLNGPWSQSAPSKDQQREIPYRFCEYGRWIRHRTINMDRKGEVRPLRGFRKCPMKTSKLVMYRATSINLTPLHSAEIINKNGELI